MTCKLSNTSLKNKDAKPVTLDQILDSLDNPVADGGIVYDLTLKASGTGEPDDQMWLRDDKTAVDEITSGADGKWSKQTTLTKYKLYKLNAIQKDVPYNYSLNKTFITATRTPIINTVVGNNGAIANGAIYYGDSLTFTGNAPPAAELKVFDGSVDLLVPVPVDAHGLFDFKMAELLNKQYTIKFQAPDGKESIVFTFTKALGALTIEDVLDEDGNSIGEGESTTRNNLTVKGKARAGRSLKLLGGIPSSVTLTANQGVWEHSFTNLPINQYSLIATMNDGSETTVPRTFGVVDVPAAPLIDVVVGEGNEIIENNGSTVSRYLTVRGIAAERQSVKLLGGPKALTDTTDDAGRFAFFVDQLAPAEYPFVVEAVAEGNPQSETFTVTILPAAKVQ